MATLLTRGAAHHHELLVLGRELGEPAPREVRVVVDGLAPLEPHELDAIGRDPRQGKQLRLQLQR